MKIRKLILAFALFFIFGATSAYASVMGEVLYTDIGTLIDDSPIESYNINDYTYVVAEDLVKYGFDVVWDGNSRTLSIYRNANKGYEIALEKEKINVKKSEIPMRRHYCNVYKTDIKTYLDGEEIEAFNVDGRTMIQVDHLARYGEFYYDDAKRLVELRIMKPSFQYGLKIREDKVSKDVDFYPGKYRTTVHYTGVVNEEGIPCGIGMVTDLGLSSVVYAYWDSYVKRDTYYSERIDAEDKNVRTYGYSDKRGSERTINVYGIGADPYTMECTGRYEFDNVCARSGVYDSTYLYGFYITDEIFYDKDGDAINYTDGKKKTFTAVMADKRFAQIAYVKTEDGEIYAAGYSGSTEDTGWESTGNPYKVFTKTNVKSFPNPYPETVATQYCSADAGAYNRVLRRYYNDVYYQRYDGIWSEIYKDQTDKLDLSSRVKVFEYANFVNIQLEDVGVVTGAAYIPYFYAVDGDEVLWHWNYEYYNQEQVGNEYDENNGYIAYGRVEYVKEPVKIAENVLKAFGTEEKYLLKKDGRVVKLTDRGEETILTNVKDMDADMFGQNFIALKNDGTVWTWGKNQNGQCGVGHTDYVWQPTEIKEVYEVLK